MIYYVTEPNRNDYYGGRRRHESGALSGNCAEYS